MSIRLKMDGFSDLLNEIKLAEGNVEKSVMKCQTKSATILEDNLKREANKSNVPSRLTNSMQPATVKNENGIITAEVGWKKGAYNPKNLSDGYKIVFLNYGTPRRKKHGKIEARGFIQRAKKKAKKPIQTQQEQTLKDILKGLKK